MKIYAFWKVLTILIFKLPVWLSEERDYKEILFYFIDIIRNSETGPLWYLTGSVIAISIIWVFKWSVKQILFFGSLAYIFGAMEDVYFSFLTQHFDMLGRLLITLKIILGNTNTGYTMGLFFIGLGIAISHKQDVTFRKGIIIGFLLSVVGLYIEAWLTGTNGTMFFSLIPVVYFGIQIVLAGCQYSISNSIGNKCWILRKMSLYMYVVHDLIGGVFLKGCNLTSFMKFIYVLLTSITVSAVLVFAGQYKTKLLRKE